MGKAKRLEKRLAAKAAQGTPQIPSSPQLNKQAFLQQKYERALNDAYKEGISEGINLTTDYFIAVLVKVLHEEFKFGNVRIQRVIDSMQAITDKVNMQEIDAVSLVEEMRNLGFEIQGRSEGEK